MVKATCLSGLAVKATCLQSIKTVKVNVLIVHALIVLQYRHFHHADALQTIAFTVSHDRYAT